VFGLNHSLYVSFLGLIDCLVEMDVIYRRTDSPVSPCLRVGRLVNVYVRSSYQATFVAKFSSLSGRDLSTYSDQKLIYNMRMLRRSGSFKVIDVGTNRKPEGCDFLLVNNASCHPISSPHYLPITSYFAPFSSYCRL